MRRQCAGMLNALNGIQLGCLIDLLAGPVCCSNSSLYRTKRKITCTQVIQVGHVDEYFIGNLSVVPSMRLKFIDWKHFVAQKPLEGTS